VAKTSSKKLTPSKKPISKPAKKKPSSPAKAVAASKTIVKSGRNAVAKSAPKFVKTVQAIKPANNKHTIKPSVVSKAAVVAKRKDKSNRSSDAPQLKPEGTPLPDRVATNLKPRKNQAGFNARELEHFRDKLLEKRREIVGDMSSMEREALRSGGTSNLSTLPIHMADMGTDNYEQEFTLGLVEKDRNLLREINNALAKIQNGTYGICEGTGKPIPKARLEVQPWARFGVEYQSRMEKGTMGVR
jgi:DnaK suppressor protein